ncbi:MAG: hypothetical protein BWK76_08955 [Desulfobulbaceae bacterium A2]|nr:MAG: hypothetical protein BWK76_08955 [Desulfobulbaceae bacterium A2]
MESAGEMWNGLFLFVVAVVAGWVDAIGGGGGLLCVPALLLAGYSPLETLATNKLQASFGSTTAACNYARHGLVDVSGQKLVVALTFLGAIGGTLAVQQIQTALLERIIPLLLLLFALYFFWAPGIGDVGRHQVISRSLFAATVGCGVGFYDGFFGPGTGTFFTMGYVVLLGCSLTQATGNAKLLNCTSNLASLFFFILSGHTIWSAGLVMGLGQMIGSYVGSHMAVRHGERLIRPVPVAVSLLVSLKLMLR